ncbi:glycosyl hydrolase [Mariniblastus sp.]|nr:glycosyl hydrolase [Mariniblastus sp.]
MNHSFKTNSQFEPIKLATSRVAVIVLTLATTFLFADQSFAQVKRGLGGNNNALITGINAGWYYNWGSNANPGIAHAEYVPMFWAGFAVNSNNIQKVINNATSQYVLGFNEPERNDQANMSVATALSKWADLQTLRDNGFILVSPAPSDTRDGREWLDEFMAGVEADPDLEVDEIAFHWYGSVNPNNPNGSANSFLNKVDQYHNTYNRPVWITEFAGIDWANNYDTATMQEANRIFLNRVVAGLESRSHVTRYAWWNHNNDSRLLASNTNLPTVTGEGWIDTIVDAGQQFNISGQEQGSDVFYLRGGTLTNTGSSVEYALQYLDATEGSSIVTGTADFGMQVGDPGYFRVRDGATLRKQGDNAVTVPSSQILNDGTVLIEDGTLLLEDGAELTGNGDVSVESGGTLATSGGIGGEEVLLDSPTITLNQGMLHVQDGLTKLPNQLVLMASSLLRTDGNLVVSGETTGAGTILAIGPGSLFLNNDGLHTGGAQVADGNLFVANTEVSPTGPGNVVVGGSGTFGGFGRVDGNLNAVGGAVAPGVAEASDGDTSTPVFDEGIVNAIDFNFAGVQDDAPLNQTSTLNVGLQLISGLDFGSGVRPRNGANDGNEFNVSGFRTDNNAGAGVNAGDYLTFTIAPVEGLAIVVQDVTFSLRRNGTGAATQYTVVSSIDGFSWPERWGNLVLATSDTTTRAFTSSNPGDEAIADEVEFRITGVGADNDTSNTHFYAASVDASFVSDPNRVAFDPTGTLELGGNYTQLGFASLKIDLGGVQPDEFDQLQVAGDVTLNGTLDVSMIDGFEPSAGQTFDIITADSISGNFTNVIVPDGMDIQVNYSNATVSLQVGASLIADFDGDGDVDVDDINSYRLLVGTSAVGELAQLDLDGDGQITDADVQIHVGTYVQTSNGQTGTFLGDFNLDGNVDVLQDAFTLIANLGNAVSSYANGDANMDGTVTVLRDAFVLIANLGSSNQP